MQFKRVDRVACGRWFDFTGKWKFFMMLVYSKNRNGQVTEINVVPQEIIKEDVKKVEELGGIE